MLHNDLFFMVPPTPPPHPATPALSCSLFTARHQPITVFIRLNIALEETPPSSKRRTYEKKY